MLQFNYKMQDFYLRFRSKEMGKADVSEFTKEQVAKSISDEIATVEKFVSDGMLLKQL